MSDAEVDDILNLPPHLLRQVVQDLRIENQRLRETCQSQEDWWAVKKVIPPADFEACRLSLLESPNAAVGPDSTGLGVHPFNVEICRRKWSWTTEDDDQMQESVDDLELEDSAFVIDQGRFTFSEDNDRDLSSGNGLLYNVISSALLFYRLTYLLGGAHTEPTLSIRLRHRGGSVLSFVFGSYFRPMISFSGSREAVEDVCDLLTFVVGPSWSGQVEGLSALSQLTADDYL